MANDSKPIGEKLRAMEEHARTESETPENRPSNKEKAEGSRETATGGGISNRPSGDEARQQQKVPPRGQSKEGRRA